VTVDSAQGKGSRFSVTMPAASDDDSAIIRGGPELGANRTILDPVADDSSDIATAPRRGPATEM
jgi:hypothetical protein